MENINLLLKVMILDSKEIMLKIYMIKRVFEILLPALSSWTEHIPSFSSPDCITV